MDEIAMTVDMDKSPAAGQPCGQQATEQHAAVAADHQWEAPAAERVGHGPTQIEREAAEGLSVADARARLFVEPIGWALEPDCRLRARQRRETGVGQRLRRQPCP